ncbi:MAG TPA: glutamyl-tRNA reductase [Thermoanaerobaculia bacterium]|nr:glutamyl-tRNA reductase [Thermoanaerobaculia bacterium]HXK66896.1 glutamyl-tRNA reductase [Thermoanaerobaculia bacterium]
MKEILLVGLNHRTAPVEVREKAAYSKEILPAVLERVYNLEDVSSCVILSTCNRTEFVLHADPVLDRDIRSLLAENLAMDPAVLQPMIYTYRQDKAVKHLFRVASALDSMVLGEPQILGQVKEAFQISFDLGQTDTLLNVLFQKAFHLAKKIRSDTGIGESAVSVSFAAVEIARKIFGSLAGKTCMVIGAGEMCELAALHLKENGVETIMVLNRTLSRAEDLAGKFGGTAHGLEDLSRLLPLADVVITSTGSQLPILTRDMLAITQRERKHAAQLIVDIAVPRDVEEEASRVDQIYLYDIDDLQHVVEENRKEREKRAEEAEKLVSAAVDTFMNRLGEFSIAPAIQELRQKMESVREDELSRCLKAMGEISEDQRQTLERFSNALLNKFLHQPIVQMKDFSGEEHAIQLIRRIFGLKED